ncbi:hypothetical protein TanjilG_29984 [Lupinus angustifolius]|uniref:Uncharacterized protein n=1 Tax=Lupinus angustifolius TaxID=3871 RepID=A0A394DCU2_LUPAN|nr:hypothetical protein TanjilG_29984 [Lupinus angustifolius]
MGLDDNDEDDNKVVDEGGGGGQDKSFGSVPCSICLEVVADNGDRFGTIEIEFLSLEFEYYVLVSFA